SDEIALVTAGAAGDLVHLRAGRQRRVAVPRAAGRSAGGAAPDDLGGTVACDLDQADDLLQIGLRVWDQYALGRLEIVVDIVLCNDIVRLRNKIAHGARDGRDPPVDGVERAGFDGPEVEYEHDR